MRTTSNITQGLSLKRRFWAAALIRIAFLSLALAAAPVFCATRYVWPGSPSPSVPYTNWDTAAHIIQDAVDASQAGDEVWVTNGIYNTGGRAVYGLMTNRVVLRNGLTVRSINGAGATWILGSGAGAGNTNGDGAIRCVYLGTNAILSGFTLTNGHTRNSGDSLLEQSGGGAWCTTNALITNCIIISNSASYAGGGVYQGTLKKCTLATNSVFGQGGGAAQSTVNDSTLLGNTATIGGGGAWLGNLTNCLFQRNAALSTTNGGGGILDSTVDRSILKENFSAGPGGGTSQGTLFNCLILSNHSAMMGGGSYLSTLINCTVVSNRSFGIFGSSAGVSQGKITNCIVYYNNYQNIDMTDGASYSCTIPTYGGTSNTTNAPMFFDLPKGDFRLFPGSPCIDAGTDAVASTNGTDLAGTPRKIGLHTDLGAYEFTGEPFIARQPISQTNTTSGMVGFTTITNFPPASFQAYQWYHDGVPLAFGTNANLVFQPPTFLDAGAYYLVVSNSVGRLTSQVASLTIVPSYTRYVWSGNPNPLPPYTNWETAATTIQDALDVAVAGETVLVTNGFYDVGASIVAGTLSNRVTVGRGVMLASVNGPAATWIVGRGTRNGTGAMRCAYLGTYATLSGFTLTNGHTLIGGDFYYDSSGGAVLCEEQASVTNCVLTGNTATGPGAGAWGGKLQNCLLTGNTTPTSGGGAAGGTLENCVVSGNRASNGGGVYACVARNCTLTLNSAKNAGGVYRSFLTNCIIYFNTTAGFDAINNYFGTDSTFAYCCVTPLPSDSNNISADPLLVDGGHLAPDSPCLGKGNAAFAAGTDIDGEPWQIPPAIGVDQYTDSAATGAVSVAIFLSRTSEAAGFTVLLSGRISGSLNKHVWDFGDGTSTTNQMVTSHYWTAPGVYTVRLTGYNDTYPAGVSATALMTVYAQPTFYVNASNASPVSPYTNWATAATSIQDAVDAGVLPHRLVVVTNGIYDTGGKVVYGQMTNRVVISNEVLVQSVNGPSVTWIVGAADPATTNGDQAVRCVYLGANASLSGFTLTNGHTRVAGDLDKEKSGGGAYCESTGTLSNCVICCSSAPINGGGAYGGTFTDCAIVFNSAANGGGGVYLSTLNRCLVASNSVMGNPYYTEGGGAYTSTLNYCVLRGNSTPGTGGGAWACTLNNCLLVNNLAGNAGGSGSGSLFNCTVVGNTATNSGGGSESDSLYNSIVCLNSAPVGSNYNYLVRANYSCAFPLPTNGGGNIALNPAFANVAQGDFRLLPGSPCIDAGNDAYTQTDWTDLAGKPRRLGSRTDMGAYEYGYPLGVAQAQAGTNSLLGVSVNVGWSETNQLYRLIFKTNLAEPGWHAIDPWQPGNGSNLSLTDPAPTNRMRFYRLVTTNW